MKTLIAAGLLLALTSVSHAETCTGPVSISVETGEGLFPKGAKVFGVGGCSFGQSAQQKRVLRTCPMGSHCRVEGKFSGDAEFEAITSVTRVQPYQEGIRDYRAGQCFRARPYSDASWEGKLWLRGWNAHQTKKQGKRDDEHCYGTRG